MNPRDSKNTLDRLWDDVPVGAPPLAALVRGGKTMRRRARLRTAGGAAALTLAVVAGSTVAANTVFDGTSPRPDREVPAAVDPPTAPVGKRLVGMGRVVIAVPADWNADGFTGCKPAAADTVWFEQKSPGIDYDCPSVTYRQPTVKYSQLDSDSGRQAAKFATTRATVDGVDMLRGRLVCPPNAWCVFSPDAAPQYVVVPSQNLAITLWGPESAQDTLNDIADSVQILPESYTTVPYIEGNNLAAWKTALAEAGLVPDGALPECDDVLAPQPGVSTNAVCDAHPRIWLDPGSGSVVATGSTVTLFTPEAPGEPMDPPASDAEPGGLDGTWAVIALTAPNGESALAEYYAGKVELTFRDGKVGGRTGCNSVFGTYERSGDEGQDLRFPRSQLGSTLVGCADEPPLVSRLADVRYVTGFGDQRYLHDAGWRIVAELRR